MVINIDNGKTNKELLPNKKGISLSNKIFKLPDRVINNRIKGTLPFTEAQAGSKENRAAVDQIFTQKAIIQNRTFKGQTAYIAFIGQEVFNSWLKTCVQGVFLNLWNRGIKCKIWKIMLKLKQNRKTTKLTTFGETKEIDIVDGIGQGKVPSGSEFSALVEETEVELKAVGFALN